VKKVNCGLRGSGLFHIRNVNGKGDHFAQYKTVKHSFSLFFDWGYGHSSSPNPRTQLKYKNVLFEFIFLAILGVRLRFLSHAATTHWKKSDFEM